MVDAQNAPGVSDEVLKRLIGCHTDFLNFLERRLGDQATAEEVLQNAFLRLLDRGGSIEDEERCVAWFYRLLRNALVDHHRKRSVETRVARDWLAEEEPYDEPELANVICACVERLLPCLTPAYAQILHRVDLDAASLETAAMELGITRNNAAVRLHRARQALKRALELSCGTCTKHGCLDCTCRK